ncbi:MAG TPA: hypothetical protein VG034_27850 [Acidimicrobiia bacterium]|jgi:photosystem II stability/assembly factor-like uncharacterized protein|nr:hypothetical protein [Acidimicrobiia bacterium]
MTSTPTSAPALAGGPVPKAFVASDLSWVSIDHGWALGTAPCASPPCTSVLETGDGGRSWVGRPAPRAPLAGSTLECDGDACVAGIRFADDQTGWAFGPALFRTADRGQNWQAERSPPVAALETAAGHVFRIVSESPLSGCLPHCPYHVEEAAPGGGSWTRLPAPPLEGYRTMVLIDWPRLYVVAFGNPAGGAGDAHAQFARSDDGGRHWLTLKDPCGHDATAENDATSAAAAPGRFLAVLCRGRGASTAAFVLTSNDAGSTWATRHSVTETALTLAAGSPDVLSVWATGTGQRKFIATSHDHGTTWTTTLTTMKPDGPNAPLWLGYEDPRTGRAFFGGQQLWTTRDGGATWAETTFGP